MGVSKIANAESSRPGFLARSHRGGFFWEIPVGAGGDVGVCVVRFVVVNKLWFDFRKSLIVFVKMLEGRVDPKMEELYFLYILNI